MQIEPEIRNQKSEIRKKPEARSPKTSLRRSVGFTHLPAQVTGLLRPSDFGLLSGFGISDFGFRVEPAPTDLLPPPDRLKAELPTPRSRVFLPEKNFARPDRFGSETAHWWMKHENALARNHYATRHENVSSVLRPPPASTRLRPICSLSRAARAGPLRPVEPGAPGRRLAAAGFRPTRAHAQSLARGWPCAPGLARTGLLGESTRLSRGRPRSWPHGRAVGRRAARSNRCSTLR